MPNILLTTFGASWQIVPELVAFTNPGLVDLFRYHPQVARIQESRKAFDIRPVDEVWIVTTKGDKTLQAVTRLKEWHESLYPLPNINIRIWQVAGTEELASEKECMIMQEAILRIVLAATEAVGNGQLILSLAGGRKTMSSNIQHAATLFGCHALLHVVDNDAFLRQLFSSGHEVFQRPLPAEWKDVITPLVVDRYERNALMDLPAEGQEAISAVNYPIEMPEHLNPLPLTVPDSIPLTRAIKGRLKKAEFLLCNYSNEVLQGESSTNFLALYSLPPSIIERLKQWRFGVEEQAADKELGLLKKLPKAELHCHLGGILNMRELIEVAEANRTLIEGHGSQLSPWLKNWKETVHTGNPEQIRNRLKDSETGRPDFKELRHAVAGVPEPLCVAAFILLFEDAPDLLDEVVFGPYRNEANFCGIGFESYENLGDLQGSGLLQNEQSIKAACRVLLRKADEHNIRYIEIRCSPANYTQGGLTPDQVVCAIEEEFEKVDSPLYSLILTASRHGLMSRVYQHIELAERLMEDENLRGFDLAGNEEARTPQEVRESLITLMERCMHFTIHAGEKVPVSHIWEAVYHLNAERIGHGLTLKDNKLLLRRFKDRGIAVEMCPSSNMQIAGFRDNYLPSTKKNEVYPLSEYLREGLRVTVNTDNPGISRTDFTNELHRAARLTPGGLNLWEILLLVRNGFKSSFAERDIRQRLLIEAENEIIRAIQEAFLK